jgi:uncharacterized membrane protein
MGDVRYPAGEISPLRRGVDSAVMGFADWLVAGLASHWLLIFNVLAAAFAFPPFLAPYLESVGQTGVARLIYVVYSYTCHQLPERSFFIFGHQMAFCERDTAIYIAVLVAGLAYAVWRHRLPRLSFRAYLLLIAPMAVDGFTQLFGWRESTWALRLITGTLFGAASVWLIYPYFDQAVDELRTGDS